LVTIFDAIITLFDIILLIYPATNYRSAVFKFMALIDNIKSNCTLVMSKTEDIV